MENFIVSARKYRPAKFDTVVGQKATTDTLKNAIRTNHLAQAFLFCGPRGVGKTSCARILAKTINCLDRTDQIEACDKCDSCKSFNEGASLNIYELDAASNNSVDDIRNLVDQVRVAPQLGSHKAYIIDEVHMLSKQAFNAFLKTLEEPPAHAIFILATTEKQKIIPTILSRCQIFDFNRITVEDIAMHLAAIAKAENIEAESEALHLIAEKADGALRDALSIFDQLISFAGSHLSYQNVIEQLNILDYEYYFKATQYLLEGDISNSLLLFNEITQKGFNGHLYINGLANHLRNLMVSKDPATLSLLEVSQNIRDRYLEQSQSCSLKFLLKSLEICRQCDTEYRNSKNQRLLVELSLMQMASIEEADLSAEKKKPKIKPPKKSKASFKAPQQEEKEAQEKTEEEEKIEIKIPEKDILSPPNTNIPAVEKKQPVLAKSAKVSIQSKTSSLSIAALTKSKEEVEEKAEEFHSDLREGIDFDKFLSTWKDLAEKIAKQGAEGSSMVYAAMTSREPSLEENGHIRLKVDNRSQLEELNSFRTDIHSYLRKKLRNGSLELHAEVIKSDKERKAYTPEEKFNKLAEENPHLQELRKKLDLDFF